MLDIFDTLGTLIGVSEQAGLMKKGNLPKADRALMADAVGTVVGATLGTSTVTSYIESSAGVQEGGRTGLTNLTVGLLFAAAVFFYPLVRMVGAGISGPGGTILYPVTAPALVIIGVLIMAGITKINWNEPSEAIPAFLTAIGIPLTFSIADGMALGFISYALLKIMSGRTKDANPAFYVISAIFLALFVARLYIK